MNPKTLPTTSIFWCPKCALVWAATEPPLCRHNVIDSPTPPVWMEPLPTWHPFAEVPA
jgi:hypothetical protein